MLVAEADQRLRAELFKPFEKHEKLALAVSGGSDSLAMLCLVDAWRKLGDRPAIHVLTVNHRLRAAAGAEAEQVALWCAARGLPHTTLVWHHSGVESAVQARARAARYDLMTDWCRAHGVDHLLTAHTLDDQAETVLMRQRRTSTPASLAGVLRERLWNGVLLSRPLLGCRRDDLRDYLRGINQPWIEDPSNENPVFERVRIRRELAAQGNDVSEALANVASEAAAQHAAGQEAAMEWVEQAQVWRDGFAEIERRPFDALADDKACYVLHLLISAQGGLGVTPGEAARLRAWLSGEGTGRRTLGGCLFAKRRRSFVVGREPGRIAAVHVTIPPAGTLLWDGRFWVHGPAGAQVMAAVHAGVQAGPASAPGFVRLGWPVILATKGEQLAGRIEFSPRLR